MIGPCHAVVFDCDGTLIDSEQAWLDMIAALVRELRLEATLLGDMRGVSAQEAAVRIRRQSTASVTHIRELIDQRYSEILVQHGSLMPGIAPLLESLAGTVALAVASNGRRVDVEGLLERAGIADYFASVITVEDVESAKPAPDLYALACARLGQSPASTVVLEDSLTGLAAARAAGCPAIALGLDPAEAADQGAQLSVASAEHLHFERDTFSFHLLSR